MSKPEAEFLPSPRLPAVPATLALDEELIGWLDGIATRTNRSRSDVAREILRAVREQEAARGAA